MNQQYRHGDLLIQKAAIPAEAQPSKGNILAYGEATGHHHSIAPLKLNGRYLISECKPTGGFVAKTVTGAELLVKYGVDFIGGRKAPTLFEKDGTLYFRCHNTTVLTHQEHGTIVLPPGDYVNTIQREYQPQALPRQVVD